MKKSLLLIMSLLVSGAMLVNCSSDSGGSAPAPEAHDSEEVDQAQDDGVQEEGETQYDENGRPINLRPNTGLNISFANGDYNVRDTAQILVFDFGNNSTRVIVEQRYFKRSSS
ncbi:MAG: hypothetical protein HRT44_01415, partial [Bdellovibrionales bacterium]|nr:hypothetical protein [Bdellovibrionales bacterium]NQZ17905.1 hypothetical protein [Bdellovibrionales bacterium]